MPAKLQVVMGKGGVGKTTLSAALALAHASAGERVALASLAGREELDLALHRGWGVAPASLHVLDLDPKAVVDGVVARLLPLPGLAGLLQSHPAYEAVYRIAPGVKELGLLHRLLALTEQGYDRVVVDAFATGHGTHFLEVPRKSGRLLVGQLAERARVLDAALTDPARTQVLLATTLEEMPVRETSELAARLRAERFPLQAILANRALERLFPDPRALEALDSLAHRAAASQVGSGMGASWGTVQRMVRGAAYVERQAREMEGHLVALRGLGAPVAVLPLVPAEEGRLRVLAEDLREAGL